ncbi:MAG: hypothetical protein O7E52_13600 [Candidatus Poribacteria bacterium]|nr:hypothetical protein [Candidatus Poribacteria bacterium]
MSAHSTNHQLLRSVKARVRRSGPCRRRRYRFWFISLAVHLCLALLLTYLTIAPRFSGEITPIKVSLLKVERSPVVQNRPEVETPVLLPKPVPALHIASASVSTQGRSIRIHRGKSAFRSPPLVASKRPPVLLRQRPVAKVSSAAPTIHASTDSFATIAYLPLQPHPPLAPVGSGQGTNEGAARHSGRGAFVRGSNAQVRVSSPVGLTSLVTTEGAANLDETLADVADNIPLGNGTLDLPKGTPGAIIQGRGREVIGHVNLVRFEDPLHPDAVI